MWNAERLLSQFYRSSSGSDDNWFARPAKKSRPVLAVPHTVQGLQALPVPIPQFNFASPDTSTTSFVDKRNTIWVTMYCTTFLHLAGWTHQQQQDAEALLSMDANGSSELKDICDKVKNYRSRSVPWLLANWEGNFFKIQSHEGRHRTWCAQQDGHQTVKIMLGFDDNTVAKDGDVFCDQASDPSSSVAPFWAKLFRVENEWIMVGHS